MKPDLTSAIKICFFGVDNKNEGVFHLKSFTLKFVFIRTNREQWSSIPGESFLLVFSVILYKNCYCMYLGLWPRHVVPPYIHMSLLAVELL